MTEHPVVASLELGGTKSIASLTQDARILQQERIATGDRPEAVLGFLIETLHRWRKETPFAAIGIASFGPVGLNAMTGELVDLVEAGVIDPAKVTRAALQNAASIAALLLTTEALVADKPEPEPPMPPGGMDPMGGMGGMGGMM